MAAVGGTTFNPANAVHDAAATDAAQHVIVTDVDFSKTIKTAVTPQQLQHIAQLVADLPAVQNLQFTAGSMVAFTRWVAAKISGTKMLKHMTQAMLGGMVKVALNS